LLGHAAHNDSIVTNQEGNHHEQASGSIQIRTGSLQRLGRRQDYVSSALPAELLELVYLRVSQINGCAYCIDMHTATC
jgi:alkylhydroperoxidase family enzyme